MQKRCCWWQHINKMQGYWIYFAVARFDYVAVVMRFMATLSTGPVPHRNAWAGSSRLRCSGQILKDTLGTFSVLKSVKFVIVYPVVCEVTDGLYLLLFSYSSLEKHNISPQEHNLEIIRWAWPPESGKSCQCLERERRIALKQSKTCKFQHNGNM